MKSRKLAVIAVIAAFSAVRCSNERSFSSNDASLGGVGGAGAAGDAGAPDLASSGGRSGGGAGSGTTAGASETQGGVAAGASNESGDGGGQAGGSEKQPGSTNSGAPGMAEPGGAAGQGGAGESAGGQAEANPGGQAGSDARGGAGSGVSCAPPSAQCLKTPPAGWQGPFLVSANAISDCPASFPLRLPTLYGGLVADTASCACDCGEPNVVCGGTASVTFYQNDGCSSSVAGVAVTEGQCLNEDRSISMSYAPEVGASCGAGAVRASISSPKWSQSLNVCGNAAAQGGCSEPDELCLASPPAPFAAKYCITSELDRACPASYPARTRMYSDYEDSRACPQTCSCTASGQRCELRVDVYSQPGCAGSLTRKEVAEGGSVCVISNTTAHKSYKAVRVASAPGTCAADAPLALAGTVSGTGATTLCCTN